MTKTYKMGKQKYLQNKKRPYEKYRYGLNASHTAGNAFGSGQVYPYVNGELALVPAGENASDCFWDDTGHLVANSTFAPMGEDGDVITWTNTDAWGINTWIYYDWDNGTGQTYPLTQSDQYLYFGENSDNVFAFLMGGYGFIGLLAIVGGMMAIAGITIMATGIKSISIVALLIVGVFGVLWWVLTGAGYALISSMPLAIGWIAYMFMSLSYVIGCLGMIVSGDGGAD